MPTQITEPGLCQCGCGRPTLLHTHNRKSAGYVKGQPAKYLQGHNRKARAATPEELALFPDEPTLCACGCGQPTPLAKVTDRRLGHIKGQPVKYIQYHGSKRPGLTPEELVLSQQFPDEPTLCACGCGQPTALATKTRRRTGYLKGQPVKYIRGHNKGRALIGEARIEARRARIRANGGLRRTRRRNGETEKITPREVWDRDGGICGICGEPADPANWHIDHIIPISKGGPHTMANVQVAHPKCNRKKWTHLPD